jgi:hypothetical protein
MAYILTIQCAAALTASAQLQWAVKEHVVDAKPGDQKVIVDYAFTNAGDYAVTIESVKTSCGCTTAELEKKLYEPGEGGAITAKFDVGSRVGLQTKHIIVKTDDAKNADVTLDLKVNIPRILTIEPQLVAWTIGEPAEARLVKIVAPEAYRVEIASAKASSSDVETSVKTITDGQEYSLAIVPKSTEQSFNGVVLIQARTPDGTEKEFRVYYRALPPPGRKMEP